MRWLQQLLCGLRGHDAVLHVEPGRIALLCTSCDFQTPGWTTGPPADAARAVELTYAQARRAACRRVA